MNFYEHHIGDFAQATSHLSFVEDAAYSRMIRKYYAEEKPLPADLRAVQRLVGARTEEEREAVETILNEFFTLEDDGWHSSRCDKEIARYQEKQDKARASANTRWSKRNATTDDAALRSHTKTDASASETDADASKTHNGRNAHQSPDTRHQTPEVSPDGDTAPAKPTRLRVPDLMTHGVSKHVAEAYLHVRQTKRGGPLTPLALAGLQREAAKAGLTLDQALTKCVERSWVGFEADWVTRQAPQGQSSLADHNRAVMQRALERAGHGATHD